MMSLHFSVQAVHRTLKSLMAILEKEATSTHDTVAREILQEVKKI